MFKTSKPSILGSIYDIIRDAHPDRNSHKFERRVLKTMEELGELSEAYLYASSPNNYKGKTYQHVREELADLIIMALDLAATRLPGEENLTPEEFEQQLMNQVQQKISKWLKVKVSA